MTVARHLVSATSALLLALTLAAYPTSFYRYATVRRLGPTSLLAARVAGGRLNLLWHSHPPTRTQTADWSAATGQVRERYFRANQRWRDAVRFDWTIDRWQTTGSAGLVARTLTVPLWAPLVATAVLPAAAAQRRITRRLRRRRGLCPTCGYDLRSTPAGRCPECGSPTPGENPGSTNAG